jgi:P pilus assembly chaperone PapD
LFAFPDPSFVGMLIAFHVQVRVPSPESKPPGTEHPETHMVRLRSINQGGNMRFSIMNLPGTRALARVARRSIITLGASLFCFAGPIQADSLADSLIVQPAQLTLSATKPVTDIVLRNTASEDRIIHVDVHGWQQIAGHDQLLPSGKLIVHPELVRLRPGESAQVRVALKLSGPLWEEQAFQLQFTEVARTPDVGSATAYSAKSQMIRRSNVEVFLRPPGTVNPRVSWDVSRDLKGAVVLKASNSGKAHVRLHSASLTGPDDRRIEMRDLSSVILPGGSRSWTLMEDALGGQWQLTADTNAGPMQAELELGPNDSASRSLALTD